jgi:hypothetical protein
VAKTIEETDRQKQEREEKKIAEKDRLARVEGRTPEEYDK